MDLIGWLFVPRATELTPLLIIAVVKSPSQLRDNPSRQVPLANADGARPRRSEHDPLTAPLSPPNRPTAAGAPSKSPPQRPVCAKLTRIAPLPLPLPPPPRALALEQIELEHTTK